MGATYSERINGVETALAIKTPVRAATTGNLTLSGLATIDGIVLAAGDRVLVWQQSNPISNGIWDVSAGAWTRSIDMNGARDVTKGTQVYVTNGTVSEGKTYVVTTEDPVIGATGINFALLALDEVILSLISQFYVSIGLGVTDETPTLQAALYAVEAQGGGVLRLVQGFDYLIDTALIIPKNVKLVGPHVDGCGSPGDNSSAPYNLTKGKVIVNPAVTITVLSNGGIVGCFLCRKGQVFPTLNATGFAGTPITIGASGTPSDIVIRNNLILGFERAVDWVAGVRARIDGNNIDCTNGIRINGCTDTSYVENNHAWPFATIQSSFEGTTGLGAGVGIERTGIAFDIVQADWCNLINNFSYGYLTGHKVRANSVNISGGGADNTQSAGPLNEGSRGLDVRANRCDIVGFRAAAQADRAVTIDSFTGAHTNVHSLTIWGCEGAAGLYLEGAGSVTIGNVNVDRALDAIVVGASVQVSDMGGHRFVGITGSLRKQVSGGNTRRSPIHPMFKTDYSTASAFLSGAMSWPGVASASAMALTFDGAQFDVTGSTAISTITGHFPGREVTLRFAAPITVNSGTGSVSAVSLVGGAGWRAAAGDVLTLVHNGSFWVEKSRAAGAGPAFLSRAQLVATNLSGLANGTVIMAGGLLYQVSSASTAITDKAGIIPYANIAPGHWGSNAAASINAAWAYFNVLCGTLPGAARAPTGAIPFWFPAGRYNEGGANIVLTTGGTGQVVYGDKHATQLCNITLNVADNNINMRDFDMWDGAKAVNAINVSPRGTTMRWGSISGIRIRDYAIGVTMTGDNAWATLSEVEVERSVTGFEVFRTTGTGLVSCAARLNDDYGIHVLSGGELRVNSCDFGNNGREGILGEYSSIVVENYWENVSVSNNMTGLTGAGVVNRDAFAIASAASNGAGGTTLTIGAHSLTEGMQDSVISETTSYNGTFDVFNVTNTTVDIAVAFVSTQTGTLRRPEWDVRFVNASGSIANMNDHFFTGCNINMMKLDGVYNFTFNACRLKEQVFLTNGCDRISRIGGGRGRQTLSYKDIDFSGQNAGFSEMIQSTPGATSFTSPGGMVLRTPDSTAPLVGNKPSRYNSVEVTSNGGVKIRGLALAMGVGVVGTVAHDGTQSSGAIIEAGSNANGTYTKFADGTMICVSQAFSSDSSTAVGSIFRSPSEVSWTFPVAFISTTGLIVTPSVTANVLTHWVSSRAIDAATGGYSIWSAVSQTARGVRLQAVGRWRT